jgi:hypothetical protein
MSGYRARYVHNALVERYFEFAPNDSRLIPAKSLRGQFMNVPNEIILLFAAGDTMTWPVAL